MISVDLKKGACILEMLTQADIASKSAITGDV